ncbi:MAG: hypothetical protein JXR34_03745 [Bacteroidales bacterium]|nr:hypothetical protein [Bacteroidales bacterium]
MKSLHSFTNLYQVNKTLRFELIPQGKTLENIEKSELIAQDEHRAESYKKVKKIIDEYHKFFISNSLENLRLEDLEDFHFEYQTASKESRIGKLKTLYKQINSDRQTASYIPEQFEKSEFGH